MNRSGVQNHVSFQLASEDSINTLRLFRISLFGRTFAARLYYTHNPSDKPRNSDRNTRTIRVFNRILIIKKVNKPKKD